MIRRGSMKPTGTMNGMGSEGTLFRLLSLTAIWIPLIALAAAAQIRRDNVLVPRPDTVRIVDTVRIAAACGPVITLGAFAGVDRSEFAQTLEWAPAVSGSPLQNLAEGTGWGMTVGGYLEVPFGSESNMSLQTGIAYTRHSFEKVGEAGAYDVHVGTPATVQPGAVRHSYTADVSYVNLTALLRWRPFRAPIYLSAGPTVASRASDLTFDENEVIEYPIGGVFPGTVFNRRQRKTVSPKATFLRYGIVGSVGLAIPIEEGMSFTADLRYNLMITPVADDEVSRIDDGGGDRSRELTGTSSDVVFSERSLNSAQFTVGIAVDL